MAFENAITLICLYIQYISVFDYIFEIFFVSIPVFIIRCAFIK